MTYSWSDRAREEVDRLIRNYEALKTDAEKVEYKTYIFEKLMNPCGSEGEFIGYWRAPLIQRRIAKRLKRVGM